VCTCPFITYGDVYSGKPSRLDTDYSSDKASSGTGWGPLGQWAGPPVYWTILSKHKLIFSAYLA